MKVELENGFKCEIDEDALQDWEIVEKLVEVEKGDPRPLPGVMKELLGEDGYTAAKDFVRTEKGRVPTQKITQLFFAILTKARGDIDSKKN